MSIPSDVLGCVFDIQRFSIHDGPGIRTNVFLKGCPLSCAWCHNPESWKREPELSYLPTPCIGCGECVKVCPHGAHKVEDGVHTFDRSKCQRCFKCTDACPTEAVSKIGKYMSVSEVLKAVLRDKDFYKNDGGMTVSGGEPFYNMEFLTALVVAAKEAGLHVCVETSGAARTEDMISLIPYIDLFLFDCKLATGEEHKRYIGNDGTHMRDNLLALDAAGAKTVLRCPIIPGVSDNREHFEYILSLSKQLSGLCQIDIEPYHTIGMSKAYSIGDEPHFSCDGFNQTAFKERIKAELMPILQNGTDVKVTI